MAVTVAALLAGAFVLVGVPSAAVADDTPPGPESFGTPTQDQLDESVRAWDPADGEVRTWTVGPDAVHQWHVTDDAVRDLEETVAGVPQDATVATGHGSAVPVAAEGGEDDDAARALNRRVEISYTG